MLSVNRKIFILKEVVLNQFKKRSSKIKDVLKCSTPIQIKIIPESVVQTVIKRAKITRVWDVTGQTFRNREIFIRTD